MAHLNLHGLPQNYGAISIKLRTERLKSLTAHRKLSLQIHDNVKSVITFSRVV